MPGSGAIFIGRMLEALPVTLLVFAVAYTTAKKKHGISNSKLRVASLFAYAFIMSGLVFAAFYDAITTGFGMTVDAGIRGTFEIPAQFLLAAIASLLVIYSIGRPRRMTEENAGK